MVRARAANRFGASIPFGAAHRVNFDNPPLKGSCGESRWIRRGGVTTRVIYRRGEFTRILVNPYESAL
jgi:hypothetical protein